MYFITWSFYQPYYFDWLAFIHSCGLSQAKWFLYTVACWLLYWDHLGIDGWQMYKIPIQRCHREHVKFPENLLRGSEATEGGRVWEGGVPPSTVWSFFVSQCWMVCSGAYFRGYFHIFLHIISVFNWVLGTYWHMVIKKKIYKLLPFWKFPEIQKFPEMWHLCYSI